MVTLDWVITVVLPPVAVLIGIGLLGKVVYDLLK